MRDTWMGGVLLGLGQRIGAMDVRAVQCACNAWCACVCNALRMRAYVSTRFESVWVEEGVGLRGELNWSLGLCGKRERRDVHTALSMHCTPADVNTLCVGQRPLDRQRAFSATRGDHPQAGQVHEAEHDLLRERAITRHGHR